MPCWLLLHLLPLTCRTIFFSTRLFHREGWKRSSHSIFSSRSLSSIKRRRFAWFTYRHKYFCKRFSMPSLNMSRYTYLLLIPDIDINKLNYLKMSSPFTLTERFWQFVNNTANSIQFENGLGCDAEDWRRFFTGPHSHATIPLYRGLRCVKRLRPGFSLARCTNTEVCFTPLGGGGHPQQVSLEAIEKKTC